MPKRVWQPLFTFIVLAIAAIVIVAICGIEILSQDF